jgi:predicted DNA-binding transcriptional regulator AlpA
MAELITLAKMPQGKDNAFIFTDEHKQFYIDNNATMHIKDICKHFGVSETTFYKLVRKHKLPKKIRIKYPLSELVFSKFFSWENAKLLDPIMF